MRCLFPVLAVLSILASTPAFASDAAKPAAEKSATSDTPAAPPRPAELDVLKLEEGIWDAAIEFPGQNPCDPPTRMRGVQTNSFMTGEGWI